ncbi:MAG: glutamate-cysteine ligase family protein [Rhodospirillaceae bacterium]|nr:glutamate-cysteine ligase family protein [Rhodospirillaceae bacterium]
MKFVENGSELWWDIRPSHAYPTVELRICDICTRLEDAVTIAALYACLIRRLMRLDREGALRPEPLTEIVAENRWIAQRYGVLAFLGDPARAGGRIDIDDYAAELIEGIAPDARALGCEAEVGRSVRIIREGAGADRQIDLYRLRLLEGDSEAEALRRVVDQALAETREGIEETPG